MKTCKQEPITIQQAAECLGIGIGRLYDALRCGKVESRRLGRERYFLPEDMKELKKHFEGREKE